MEIFKIILRNNPERRNANYSLIFLLLQKAGSNMATIFQSVFKAINQLWNKFFVRKLRDKKFENEHRYPDEIAAARAFLRSREKLFHIDAWSDLKGLASSFELYDAQGSRSTAIRPEPGDFVRILLPGMDTENWVQVTEVIENHCEAKFTVHPSAAPHSGENQREPVQHFFIRESSSTFRVSRSGALLYASETGKNEVVNNEGYEAGDRKLLNTLIAAGGWAGIQKLQWEKLTRWLIHLEPDKHGR